jgi:hypothetical protein
MGNVLTLAPPLTISDEMNRALGILEESLEKIESCGSSEPSPSVGSRGRRGFHPRLGKYE